MVERGVKAEPGELFLPPGFRFHPTDAEVITSYLLQKFLNPSFAPRAMGEVNLNKVEPWDLPSKATMGEKEWYFFCHKDMKYPTGTRTNRATKEGYWKATGKDREIFKPTSGGRELVGMKKTLVFYMGRAPRGSKTNWVMHEFRLEGKHREDNASLRHSRKDEWVVCKVFHKNNGEDKTAAAVESSVGTPNVSSISVDAAATADVDDFLDSMIEPMYFNSTGSLPDLTTTEGAVAELFNAANNYSISSTAAAAATTGSTVGSFVDLPNYTFSDTTRSRNNLNYQAAVANSTVPTGSSYSSSSWNLLHAGHIPMGSYNLHDEAMMARVLEGVISPNFSAGLPASSATGISQQTNSLGRGGYASSTNYLTAGAATATGQAAAKNLEQRAAEWEQSFH